MELLVVVALIILVIAILAFIFKTILFFWPVVLVLLIAYAVKRTIDSHKKVNDHDFKDQGNYDRDDNPDVIDVEYKVIDDEDHKKE